MGGFVAAPVAWAATKEQLPLTLVNLDATPGRANRFIASRAQRIFSAAETDGKLAGCTVVRPIVRAAAVSDGRGGDQHACREALGLSVHDPVLFVTGASQGATSINQFVCEFVRANAAALREGRWQIVHQTGKSRGETREDDADVCRRTYTQAGLTSVVQPYFTQMGLCWAAADCAVSRAGAGSVAEAWANSTPTLFFPYPYHRDQHQKQNARVLSTCGSCLVCEDKIYAAANLTAHGAVLLGLLRAPERLKPMKLAFNTLGPTDGAARIAEHLCA
jgi:UDP-N-acetylglucosamine--N-acetylmuramyl-(pentapeptide) pyrophosphoryl-undecaprenol N-acetylglucosamine transferase